MDEGLIPRRYAKALLKLAVEKHSDDRIYDLMQRLCESFDSEPELTKVASNPFVKPADVNALLCTAAGATDKDVIFVDFLKLLERNRRLPVIRSAANAYVELYRKEHRIYKVVVTAAAPMDAEEEGRLKALIEKHLEGGKMEYSFKVNPSLIGGFVVSIDSERLDASVANELKQMRNKLLSK